jgi:single-strand DNA-binding protein
MTIPTQMSLHGFIATDPELTFIGRGVARFHARAGIEQWRREPSGDLTRLDPVFCDLVLFGRRAERAHDRFREGDQFVASGCINQYDRQRDGHTVLCEEFVARRMGHDSFRTRYTVDREHPNPPPTPPSPTATVVPEPAVGI